MDVINRPDLVIAQYNSEDWENFVLDYTKSLVASGEYKDCTRLGGTGDGGRDVVAFCTEDRYDGEWDNYQCKFYRTALGIKHILKETGKVIHHAFIGEFTMPRTNYFVARSGYTREAQDFLDHPSQLRSRLLADWDTVIASKKSPKIPILSDTLKNLIETGKIPKIGYKSIDSVLETLKKTCFYNERFGGIPPDYIKIPPPDTPAKAENRYIRQALDAYEDRRGRPYADVKALIGDEELMEHLQDQRELFYEAESFQRTYSENSPEGAVSEISEQILKGVKPIERNINHSDSLSRLDSVIGGAGALKPTGLLSSRAKIQVKQGFCHHFANIDRLKWRKKDA